MNQKLLFYWQHGRLTRRASFSALCFCCSSCSFSSYWLYSFLVISLITSALASWEDSTCKETHLRGMAFAGSGLSAPFALSISCADTQRSKTHVPGLCHRRRQQELMGKEKMEGKGWTGAQKIKSGTDFTRERCSTWVNFSKSRNLPEYQPHLIPKSAIFKLNSL